jgi:hypothetical protein
MEFNPRRSAKNIPTYVYLVSRLLSNGHIQRVNEYYSLCSDILMPQKATFQMSTSCKELHGNKAARDPWTLHHPAEALFFSLSAAARSRGCDVMTSLQLST